MTALVPPAIVIEHARKTALLSPCAKSKRGVVVYSPHVPELPYGTGYNGPPEPFLCGQTNECRRDCAQICVHAEMRAIFKMARAGLHEFTRLDVLHVKVVDEVVVPTGGPSCVGCSKAILDAKLKGVWLYEVVDAPRPPLGVWRYYPSLRFHELSLEANGLSQCRAGGKP